MVVAVSQDHDIALQPRWQSKILSQKKKNADVHVHEILLAIILVGNTKEVFQNDGCTTIYSHEIVW